MKSKHSLKYINKYNASANYIEQREEDITFNQITVFTTHIDVQSLAPERIHNDGTKVACLLVAIMKISTRWRIWSVHGPHKDRQPHTMDT